MCLMIDVLGVLKACGAGSVGGGLSRGVTRGHRGGLEDASHAGTGHTDKNIYNTFL